MSLRHSILASLSRRERTGYELTHSVDESFGFFWSATHQQVYKELSALKKARFVAFRAVQQTGKPAKKVYTITDKGLAELKQWMREPVEPPPAKDALLIKLFAGTLVEPEVLLAEVNRQCAAHRARYAKYLEIEKAYFSRPEALSRQSKYQYLTLKRGISHERAWLSWAKEAEALLTEELTRRRNS